MQKVLGKYLVIVLVMLSLAGFVTAGILSPTESAGAAELYNSLVPEEDQLHISPGPNFDVCGAYENDHRVTLKGPEVNEGVVSGFEAHFEACMDTRFHQGYCVLPAREEGTELVPEGYVGNVAAYYNEWNVENNDYDLDYPVDDSYQEGGDSPDWNVCLNTDKSSIGGSWYNLDDAEVNEYLRDESNHNLDLNPVQREGDPDHIDYYWGRNPNPPHTKYNPEGGREGTSLLAGCGPLMKGCGNERDRVRGGLNDLNGTYHAFFEEEYQGEPVRITDSDRPEVTHEHD